MRFHKKLILSERARKNKYKIMRRFKAGTPMLDLYVLALPHCDNNQIEIYSSTMFLQPALLKTDPYIIGFAYGYEEAVALVTRLTERVYAETGTGCIRVYIEEQIENN